MIGKTEQESNNIILAMVSKWFKRKALILDGVKTKGNGYAAMES